MKVKAGRVPCPPLSVKGDDVRQRIRESETSSGHPCQQDDQSVRTEASPHRDPDFPRAESLAWLGLPEITLGSMKERCSRQSGCQAWRVHRSSFDSSWFDAPDIGCETRSRGDQTQLLPFKLQRRLHRSDSALIGTSFMHDRSRTSFTPIPCFHRRNSFADSAGDARARSRRRPNSQSFNETSRYG